ncbi:nucleoside-diphosphate kinase [Candidatus Pacearchaeota archaeon]|nr:nucleoside-diphosphate kinase [Candidatus Pacearchaeota archaeon]
MERTLILLKHDAVSKGITGRIISRFEDAGLKITAMKMVWADEDLAGQHYKLDEAWAKKLYDRTKKVFDEEGKEMPYKDHMHMGQKIQGWNKKFLQEGPIIALVLEGPHAVEVGRDMLGHTEPRQAAPGTIRGDFAKLESYNLADKKQRVLRNIAHGSDTPENAEHEIHTWFTKEELHEYAKDLDKHF